MDQEDLPPLENDSEVCANGNCENDSDFTDNDSDEEPMDQGESTICLFCTQVLPSVELALEHIKTVHKVNFSQLKAQFQMDQYSFIKLINCIRLEGISEEKLQNVTTAFWNDEKYLKPKEYESWLSYDYDDLKTETTSTEIAANEANLKALVLKLQEQVKFQQEQLEQASQDMETMRKGFQRLMEKDDKKIETKNKNITCVSSVSLKADEGYFDSYAHFGIHHEMLSDVVRTTSYRDALLKNKDFVKGKYVLDVGCGTSVLSIFASQAGAAKVVGIDNSDIIYNAMDIVKKNNVENITLVKGRLEDTELPEQKFDIIISEWMGYFLLFEGMLDSVIYARDNHLKENGILLPNRCTMSIVGYGNESLFKNHVTFWNDVYGLNMSNMRKEVMHEPLIDIVDAQHILTDANCIADLDLMKVDLNYSNFKYNFELTCCKDGELSSFVGYFDTFFELPEPVMFGTSPNDKPTHWKQVVFFIEEPQAVKKGDVVRGVIHCKRSHKSARSLDIILEAFNKKYTYYLD
ncbi:protein arginine N-methyltransferase 1 [Lucilia cuprina]|uniref:protein arginine N-methyltransferase 1 n=1 Tax=Lucilia cuprina TaxID=7375 RepID=UPI001F05D60E|nr:protein arginine N-methyltransferase 1 [Lucilia cuprina]XP_046805775.1 protein arginine N-methyltransferase 1 [Lucilia cuprina]